MPIFKFKYCLKGGVLKSGGGVLKSRGGVLNPAPAM